MLLALVAATAFFWRSADTPSGYHVDSVSVALNAHCLVETGADEYGDRWPLVGFRSLDDYKGSLNLYVVAAVFAVTGPSLQVVRVTSMAFAWIAVSVLAVSLRRASELPSGSRLTPDVVFFSLLLLSPWLLVPVRVFVEDGIMLATMVAVLVATLRLLDNPQAIHLGIAAGTAAGLLSHCYSPGKVLFVAHPLVVLAALALDSSRGVRRTLRLPGFVASVISAAGVALPHLLDLAGGQRGLSRFRTVEGGFRPWPMAQSLAANMGPDFLFFSGDPDPNHHLGIGGMLNIFFLPFLLIGVLTLAHRSTRDARARYLLLLLPTCFLPATLAERSPVHALRTLLAVVPLAAVSHCGLVVARRTLASMRRGRAATAILILWTCLGAYRATQTLGALFDSYSKRDDWAYLHPDPSWMGRGTGSRPDDHAVNSIAERYHRAAVGGESVYCEGSAR